MSVLTTIRNSISGTTHFFQRDVKSLWTFFTLFFIAFGVVQLLVVIAYFFAYSSVYSSYEQEYFQASFFDIGSGKLISYIDYTSTYSLLFLVLMIKGSGGSKAESLSFGQLFQRITFKTVVIYFVSVASTLSGVIYLIDSIDTFYGDSRLDELLQLVYVEEEWYATFLRTCGLYLIKFIPIYVVGYYLISLKEGNWKWEYLRMYWKQVSAILLLFLCLNGVFETVNDLLGKVIIQTLVHVVENSTIILILSVAFSALISIVYYGLLGYLAYFAIFTEKDENVDEEPTIDLNTSDILDQ